MGYNKDQWFVFFKHYTFSHWFFVIYIQKEEIWMQGLKHLTTV